MSTIPHLSKTYIRGTTKKAVVQLVDSFLCHITSAVRKGIRIEHSKVYISTRVIKHVYDKRPAEEFDFCIENTHLVVKYPDSIYRNKKGKRGDFCFVKEVKNFKCFVSIEVVDNSEEKPPHCEVVTFYRINNKYLESYELLWEWKGGIPSS
ncbi:MAG: hypothetical protein WDZ85_02455 [Candidatus Paceibacterota bacterium]